VVLLAALVPLLGCGRPASWQHSGVVIVSVGPPAPGHHVCTGAVVSSTPDTKIVLTARHCVVDERGAAGADVFQITYPRPGSNGDDWRTLPARIIRTGASDPQRPTPGAESWTWLDNDWALLRVDTTEPMVALPIFDGDPATAIPPGAPLELVSCYDSGEPQYRCHTHPLAFGDRPRELIEGGHSGAPILWHGRLIATFTGGTPTWFLFYRRFWWLRALTVGSIAPVRAALADTMAMQYEQSR
jgi:hypothetical protein